jgi:hypothetical protein
VNLTRAPNLKETERNCYLESQQGQSMSIKRERFTTETAFEDLLGKPAFSKSEDPRDYERLRAAIEREMDPKNIFDKIKGSRPDR